MDYEKKYKETLEKAKAFLKRWGCVEEANSFLVMEEVKDIFPELKVSEDERIKREILDLVSIAGNGNQFEEIKDWLEKLGEDKKEINNFDVLPGLYKCVHRMFDGTPESRLLFEVGNMYKCLSKHSRAEFEVSYGHSIYLEDPVVRKHFIPFKNKVKSKL